jgi:hypothetical protein
MDNHDKTGGKIMNEIKRRSMEEQPAGNFNQDKVWSPPQIADLNAQDTRGTFGTGGDGVDEFS